MGAEPMTRVTALAGGFGGAKLSHGLALLAAEHAGLRLSVVVNTADDFELHGLHVAPDLDTVMYTLAGLANPDTGWGIRDETWSAAEMLATYGAPTWFRVGDRDLATHVRRTARLDGGASLTQVTEELRRSLGVTARLLPMTDDRVRTQIRTDEGWLEFQDYFVRRGHADQVRELRFEGLGGARPTPAVVRAVASADTIVLAPSNPFLSIAPILGLDGVAEAIRATGAPVVAVSPIVGGKALRGPADRILESLGGEASALGIARHYAGSVPGLLNGLVIDTADRAAASPVERLGLAVRVTNTVMRTDADRAKLAADVLGFAEELVGA
ncbi:MAG: 2-phospho-L-lactate transferase [Chloroflexi bacterium]|nr:2-phospho-L-lactate transferase [Chloroflexota bacterium]